MTIVSMMVLARPDKRRGSRATQNRSKDESVCEPPPPGFGERYFDSLFFFFFFLLPDAACSFALRRFLYPQIVGSVLSTFSNEILCSCRELDSLSYVRQ